MSNVDKPKPFDLTSHLSAGDRFTSGEIRSLMAGKLKVDSQQLEMADVYAAISALNRLRGDIEISGDRFVYNPLAMPPAKTAGLIF
jgi:hypothetical protein